MYNVTIQALNQGTPQLMGVASLIVNVQDINDNPPEFASKLYYAKVPEIYAVGTEVARVLATSKDTRVNADIYYSIVGGNEHKKFQIDAKTGVLIIAEQLDYERARDYFLTIQAVDGGIPPLSNHATVNITVTDSNDNAPIFSEVSYRAFVREDAKIGEKVTQVSFSVFTICISIFQKTVLRFIIQLPWNFLSSFLFFSYFYSIFVFYSIIFFH